MNLKCYLFPSIHRLLPLPSSSSWNLVWLSSAFFFQSLSGCSATQVSFIENQITYRNRNVGNSVIRGKDVGTNAKVRIVTIFMYCEIKCWRNGERWVMMKLNHAMIRLAMKENRAYSQPLMESVLSWNSNTQGAPRRDVEWVWRDFLSLFIISVYWSEQL